MKPQRHSARAELYRLISNGVDIGADFSVDLTHSLESHFRSLYPGNSNIRNSLNKYLQLLAKDGLIKFTNHRGDYRRLR